MQVIEIDFKNVRSLEGLLHLLVERLHLGLPAAIDWSHFLTALRHGTTGERTLRLMNLSLLEEALPEAALSMLTVFREHNTTSPDSRCYLVAGGDYTRAVFFAQFAARRTSARHDTVECAYVNCWVKAEGPAIAEAVARASIESAEWTITSCTEDPSLVRDSYPADDPRADHVAQALIDGGAYIFHVWDEDLD